MNEADLGLIAASFLLGVNVAEAVNKIPCGTSPHGDLVDCLIRVARGEQTFVPSGIDIRMKAADSPDVPSPQEIEAIRRDNQKAYQMVAEIIIKLLQQPGR